MVPPNYLGGDECDAVETTQENSINAQELKTLILLGWYQRVHLTVYLKMGRVFMWVLSP
tara:strand:+ start:2586 stop:2762 length:177 start_codon:yes stop_codon:yes gene_type:complete